MVGACMVQGLCHGNSIRHAAKAKARPAFTPLRPHCATLSPPACRCSGALRGLASTGYAPPTKALDAARESLDAAVGPVDAATPEAETGVSGCSNRLRPRCTPKYNSPNWTNRAGHVLVH